MGQRDPLTFLPALTMTVIPPWCLDRACPRQMSTMTPERGNHHSRRKAVALWGSSPFPVNQTDAYSSDAATAVLTFRVNAARSRV